MTICTIQYALGDAKGNVLPCPRREAELIGEDILIDNHTVILMLLIGGATPMGSMGGGHRLPTAEAVGYVSTAAMRLPPAITVTPKTHHRNHKPAAVHTSVIPLSQSRHINTAVNRHSSTPTSQHSHTIVTA